MADHPYDHHRRSRSDDSLDLMSPKETEFLFSASSNYSETASFKTARTHLTTKPSDLSDRPWPVAPLPYDYQSYPMSPQEPLVRHQTDPLLVAASAGIYEEVRPRVSPVKAINTFYKPTYAPLDAKDRKHPRYCWGRMSRWQFVTMHILLLLLLLALILIPLGYYVIAPSYIQYRIDTLDPSTLSMDTLVVRDFSNNTVAFDIKATLPPLLFLPLSAGFGPCTFTLYDSADAPLAHLNVPRIDFVLNEDLKLDFSGNLDLNSVNVQAIQSHVRGFSSKEGLKNVRIDGRSAVPLHALGIQWYSGLSLHKVLPLGDLKSDLGVLMEKIPSFMKSTDLPNNQTRAHFDDSDLISILPEEGIPELAITKLDVTMTDTGARMATEIAFESPFKISVHGLHGLGLGLAIDDETVLRMHLQDLNLEKGFQVMPLTLELDVEHALIQRDRVSRAFTTLTDQILKEDYGSILASMSGPILVKDLPTLNEMTQDLQIYLPVKKVLDSISVDDIKGFVSVDGITSVLKKSWLGLSVGSDTITVDSNLVLPPFLAIPRHISFPYTTAISVGSPSVSALAIRVDPVTIVRDDSSIHVSTKITVIPVNTIDAADALGQSINPLLAAVPRASTITLRDLGMTDGSGHRFDWTSHLFSKANLPFPLPNIICKVCVLDMLTNGGKEIPLSIPAMDVTQLESDPGFNAKGAVNIALPGWLPEIHVAIGYLDLAVTVETTAIAEAVLDGGLRFDKAQRITPLNANLYFKQSIADKIQSLVSAFMSTDHDSSAGMTGFHMGPDRSRKIVTFSRIIVEIDVTSIRDIAMMIGKGAITSLIIPDMLVVQSVDLNVPSSTKVLLGMGTALHNPTPFSLNVGSVAFDAFVDGEFMTGISLSPLSISRGLGPLNLGLDMTISKGTDILSAKIGALVRQVVGLANQGLGFSEFMADSLQMLGEVFYTIDVTHLTLSPRHNPNGHGKIDMLSPVKLSLQVSQLYALSSALIGTQAAFSPVSIAPLLPSKDNLFQLDPSIRSAALEATPHGSLEVGASVGYTNPLPISVHIPYCSATVTLGGLEKDLVIAHILGIHLSRGRGLLDIIAALKFPQTDPNMPVSFSNLLSQFLGGTISPSIGIKALSFGSGPGDVNVLLSHVAIELDFVTKHLGWIGPYALQHGQQLLELYIQEYVNENSLQIVSTASGGLEVQISNSLGLVLHDLAVNFLPSRQMSISVNTAVVFPFPVTLRLPFLRFSMGLDDFPFMDIRITGLSMNGQGSNEMSLGMHIIFHESEALTNAFNRLSTQLMKGFEGKDMLQFGSLFLGFTESDTIQTFSLVSIPLPLEPVIAILSKVFTNLSHRIDIVKLLDALGISLASLKARSLPHRTLDAGAGISFQNNFKFTLHGLGHVEANIALDKEEMIDLSSSGLNLRPGLNTIDFGANLTFHSSATLQSNVAKMFETIANSGMGNNAEIISVSGVKFGYFDSEPIGFLSGIIVSFPASYVLNKQVLDIVSALVQKALNLKMEDLRLQALMERLDIGRVNLDTTVADRILLEGQVGVKKIPTEFDIDIGFTGGFADLDTERLCDFSLPSGLKLVSDNMTLNTDFVAHAALGKSEALQDSIATVVSLILEDKEINNYLAVSNIVFGMDANDYIDTFSKAIIKLPINPVVKPSKSFVLQLLDDLLKGNSSLGLDIQNLDVDVPEHNTFGAKAGFRLIGIPRTVSVNIPYASIGILLDESDFLHAYVGLMMTEGLVSMDVSVPFVDNKENGHKLLQVVYNLLWHQKDVLPYSFGILGVSFGASKDAAFELASKVKAPVPFGLIVGLLKGYIDGERPFELTNIPTLVNNKGIEATVFAKELPSFLPVTFKCPVFNASILYQVKGAGPLLHAADVLFTNMEVVPKKPISMEVLIVPDFERDQIVEALKEAVPFMLNGTDYCQNARLGHMTIQGSTGAVFDIMSQGYFQAPELYFYKPISLAVRPSNPFRKAGLEIIPVEFAITFPNPGPLHLDVGDFDIAINNDGRELITVQTPGSVVIKNAMHGGNDLSIPNPDNGIFRVLLPWKNLNPLEFFKHLLGLLNPKKYSLSVDVIRPSEGPIMWIRELASKLVDKDEIKVFIPVLMSLVGRIHWKLFGIKLNHQKDELEGSQEFLDRSDTIMKEYHNSSASSFFNLIVDDHFD